MGSSGLRANAVAIMNCQCIRCGEEAGRILMSIVNSRMEMGSSSHCSVPPYPRGAIPIFGKLAEGYVNIPVRFVTYVTPPQLLSAEKLTLC